MMKKKELPNNREVVIYSPILVETTERKRIVHFCEEDFFSQIAYNDEFDSVKEYLLHFLNDYDEHRFCREGEEVTDILEPIDDELISKANIRIQRSKMRLYKSILLKL